MSPKMECRTARNVQNREECEVYLRRRVRLRVISTAAGTINVAHAKPRTRPVIKRDNWVFSQMPKIVSDQSIEIGMIERNNQNRGSGSVDSIGRQRG